MALNNILYGGAGDESTTTATTIVLGYAPGQTVPVRNIALNATASSTLTLPPIPTSYSTTNPGAVTQGCGNGFTLTIKQLQGQTCTVSAASGDTIFDTLTLTATTNVVTLFSSLGDKKWYKQSSV